MSYVFSLFFGVIFFPIDQRATMGCPDSTLGRPNSRIFSTSLDMTRANHHSPNHVAAAPIVCYRIWDASAIVRLILAVLVGGHAGGVADEFAAFFLFYFIFLLCVLVNSIVLLTNGISFAIQAVLLVMIGAWADYGTWRCARDRTF
jgi:Vacuole effluxer Atg22 like